jgi:CxxC motif-containing protein (DUF1111 family)
VHDRSQVTRDVSKRLIAKILAVILAFMVSWVVEAQSGGSGSGTTVSDPGPRTTGSTPDAGGPFPGLTQDELLFFNDGKTRFKTKETVAKGLGPTFNGKSCAECHAQPAVGGSSPSVNPEYSEVPPDNELPYFVTQNGPVLEARFLFYTTTDSSGNVVLTNVPDGSVHDLYTIQGLNGAGNCQMSQPNFGLMNQLGNIVFRIPTPLFGLGLLETITDNTIINNMNANSNRKASLGITGFPNRSGNTHSITRFGWKAQNPTGQLFAGEAYDVEMGVTNEQFDQERGNSSVQNAQNDPPTSCILNPIPEDATNFTSSGTGIPSDIVEFSHFMRFLAPPTQDSTGIPGNPSSASISNGKQQFENVGCNMCHTESLPTTLSVYDNPPNTVTGYFLSNQTVNLFSDLLVHHMGGLADGVTQGLAKGDEFRTAPLWGVGQRLFFLHNGTATDLLMAIEDHALPPPSGSGYPQSEAYQVITNFNNLSQQNQQDLLNFLRSL